jgi:hypothetical protein
MSIQTDSTMVAVATPPAPPPAELAAPTPTPKRRRRLVLGAIGVLVIALAAGAVLANASLSQTYSASQAVQDYYAAMAHRDADGMVANATFLKGEGSYSYFFGKPAAEGMLKLPANSDIHNVKITADRQIDGSSRAITISMVWNGKARSETLTVRKDPAQVHWLFYSSWRVEIPSTQIHVTLPNQAGIVSLDGIPGSSDNRTAIQAIQGFHRVTMAATTLLESTSQDVDAVDSPATVKLAGTIRASALEAAGKAVKEGLTSSECDSKKYDGCFNHTYSAPDRNFIYYFPLPGYGNVNYTKYVSALTNDPAVGMKLTVEAETGKVSVSGSCTETLTVDGSRQYKLKGDYNGTLTWAGDGFDPDLSWNCERAKG